jgi:aryl-alcohol dehydrogenase-like predicted oxidoreductase
MTTTDDLTTAFGPQRVPVTRLGFGGAVAGLANYLGHYDAEAPANRARVIAAIRRAIELGVTYFDTAPGYGNGLSETLFGEALKGEDVYLATKVQLRFAGNVRRSLEASLTRLQRDRVDLLQLHGNSYDTDQETMVLRSGGMLDELRRLKDAGLVGAIGFTSEDNNAAVYRFIESGGFDVMQLCYNFINQHPYEPSRPFGSVYEAKKRGMSVVTMRSATSGVVQRWIGMVNPDNRFDYTAALIQFVLSNPLVDVALVGMRDPDIVESTVRIWRNRAGRIDIAALHERYVQTS